MKTIARFHDFMQAQLARSALEASGVPAFLPEEGQTAYVHPIDGMRLQVWPEQEDEARAILADLWKGNVEILEEPEVASETPPAGAEGAAIGLHRVDGSDPSGDGCCDTCPHCGARVRGLLGRLRVWLNRRRCPRCFQGLTAD